MSFHIEAQAITTAIESCVEYTREDLLKLQEFLAPGSPIVYILNSVEFDPERFSKSLCGLTKEWGFIYATPLRDLPLTIGDPRFEGWRKWRFSIGK